MNFPHVPFIQDPQSLVKAGRKYELGSIILVFDDDLNPNLVRIAYRTIGMIQCRHLETGKLQTLPVTNILGELSIGGTPILYQGQVLRFNLTLLGQYFYGLLTKTEKSQFLPKS